MPVPYVKIIPATLSYINPDNPMNIIQHHKSTPPVAKALVGY